MPKRKIIRMPDPLIPSTLEELAALPGEVVTARDISKILKADPQTIRWNAKDGLLQFPVIFCGKSVKIPKRAFIAYMSGTLTKETLPCVQPPHPPSDT